MECIASKWKALSGIENNWNGLLDPIDDNLRRYLVQYGERISAVNDCFNGVEQSDGYGLCLFPTEELFIRAGLELGNPFKYEVSDCFYARSEVEIGDWAKRQSAFMGYVAVATDEGKLVLGRRDILICWRGTRLPIEWLKNINFCQTSAPEVFPGNNAKVHQGFLNVYTDKSANSVYSKTSAREQVLAVVRRLVDKYSALNEDVSITVVGHSLGGALATLNAMDIVFNGYNKPSGSTSVVYPVTAFVYGCPRVGDKTFLELFNSLPNLHLLRIRNNKDIVPDLPPDLIITRYSEVGVQLYINTQNSADIKTHTNVQSHDLNLHFYGIAAYQGEGNDFKLGFDFDVALVNKYDDLLNALYKVPPTWWTSVINKGLVQMENGFWKLNDYIPPPPPDLILS
ncbi:phospholipase A1-II 1-like [Euphorbia lathyris]|uniref:phospholipase A1-II 1-like n=1 Tax=Euphorbia lathyris TaxID=212925 RepID=UPI003313F074